MNNHYDILGITRNASKDDIKNNYKKLANIYHPDKGGNPDYFKKIKLAYEILSDESSRKKYDSSITQLATITKPKPNTDYVKPTTKPKPNNSKSNAEINQSLPFKKLFLIFFIIFLIRLALN